MTDKKVVITAISLRTSNIANFEQLCEDCQTDTIHLQDSSLSELVLFDSSYTSEIKGTHKKFNLEQNMERFDCIISEVLLELIHQIDEYNNLRKQINNGQIKSSMFLASSLVGNERIMNRAKDIEFPYGEYSVNEYIQNIKKITQLYCPIYTIDTACSSGTNSLLAAFQSINNGSLDFAFVGGFDPLTEFTLHGFNSLRLLDTEVTKPLSINRNGINLGEAVVWFALESLESAQARGARIICEVKGGCSGNDAYHMTSPNPNTDTLIHVLNKTVTDNKFKYINMHGTGTKINDEYELNLLSDFVENISPEHTVYVSSSKSKYGHCLASAGLIEVAICLTSFKNRKLPISPEYFNKMDDAHLYVKILDEYVDIKNSRENVLSVSMAFGGNVSAILLGDI